MSIKKILSFSTGILLLLSIATEAQIPAGYYDDAVGKTGAELKTALNAIVNTGLNRISYGDSRYILDETDQDPANPDNVILVYRGTSVSGDWDGGVTWNREHVWPQSLLGVNVVTQDKNVGTDLHNLKPANPSENSSRSNKYYDNQTTSSSYAPRDAVKGDLARILFYMVVAYEEYPLDLELVNHEPYLYQMAMLDVLLKWHELDPVDSFEQNRNEVIYSYQHNRNPFIDHPEYVALIWSENPPPLAPSNLMAIDTAQTALLLSWSDNSTDESGFYIYQNSARIDSVAADSTRYQVTNLLPGTLYSFAVTAYNAFGESAAATLEITTLPDDSSGAIPDSLFFSEYIEGSGFNKALEIYNASSHSVNLSNYAILANSNNSSWYQTHYSFPAGTVLEPGAVWVIMNSGFDSTYHSIADELTAAAVVNFNGNDVRALVKFNAGDTTFLDVIGLYNDTAEVKSWSVAGIADATENHTLVRKSSVKCGNPDWLSSAGSYSADSEWIVYASNTFDFLGYHVVDTVSAIGICTVTPVVEHFRLYSCYPNPFNPTTKIRYDLEKTTTVTLQVFDLRGVLIKTLVHARQQPGHYSILWDARDQQRRSVPAGVYLYRLQTADGFGQTGKMIYLK
ncbi:MAG TPA: T9SS type A sorting domain-containing protein [Candidatus Marinimicrobia bacterium]|nr:T9SS type A sorting domain-containing protein [Candidatus Neomarinimicrobiota bacterium]